MATTYYKFTVFNNFAQWGWTDVFYYISDQPISSVDMLDAASALQYQLRRKNVVDVSIPGVRVTELNRADPLLKSFQRVRPFTASQLGGQDGSVIGNMKSPWSAAMFQIPSRDTLYKRPWLVRGMLDAWLKPIPGTTTGGGELAQLLGWKDQFGAKILGRKPNGQPAATDFAGTFAMKGVVKDPTLTLRTDIQIIDTSNTDSRIRVTFTPPAGWSQNPSLTGPQVGQWVVLRGVKLRCGNKVNGTSQIQVVTPLTNGVYIVTLAKRWCCYPAPLDAKVNGTIALLKYDLFSLGGMNFQRIVKRDTGAPFFGTRGRASGRCC